MGGILKRGFDVVGADYTLFMSMINMFFTQNSSRKFGEEEELKVLATMHPSYQSADVKKGKFLGERNRTPFSKVHFCHNFRRKRRKMGKIITCL